MHSLHFITVTVINAFSLLVQIWAYAVLHLQAIHLIDDTPKFPDSRRWNKGNRRKDKRGQQHYLRDNLRRALASGYGLDEAVPISGQWGFPWDPIRNQIGGHTMRLTRSRVILRSIEDAIYLGERVSLQHRSGARRYIPADPPLYVRRLRSMPTADRDTLLVGIVARRDGPNPLMYEGDYVTTMTGRVMFDLTVFTGYAPHAREPARASDAGPVEAEREYPFLRSYSTAEHWHFAPSMPRLDYSVYDPEGRTLWRRPIEQASDDDQDGEVEEIAETARAVWLYPLSIYLLAYCFTLCTCTQLY